VAAEQTGSSKQPAGDSARSALICTEPDPKSMEIPVVSWLLDKALPCAPCLSPSWLRMLQASGSHVPVIATIEPRVVYVNEPSLGN